MVDLIAAGLLFVFAGLGVMLASILLETRRAGGKVRGGGVLMIGPFPIIFGSAAKWGSIAIVLAIVLVVLTLLLYLV